MPPAAKKKKLKRETGAGTVPGTVPGPGPTVPVSFAHAFIRCRKTPTYASAYKAMTLDSAKRANRRLGTANWYRLNKGALVATIVLNHFAERIKGFFKHVQSTRECPISFEPMSKIPRGDRFRHGNVWFDKKVFARYLRKTSDFTNPVTRVELRAQDVVKIDPGLMNQFENRRELVACMAEHAAVVQSVENELEEVFQTMVEAAQEIRTRIEFSIVFDSLAEDFQQCRDDLVDLDRDRSVLAMKSLGDLVDGDPNRRVNMSKKRERILRHFLTTQNV